MYYALPAGVVLVLVLVAFAVCGKPRRSEWLTVVFGVAAWWYVATIHTGVASASRPAADVRLMMWNVYHGKWGYRQVIDTIRDLNPDIVALIEAGPNATQYQTFWTERFPDYHVVPIDREYVLLSRTPATLQPLPKAIKRRVRHVTVHHDEGPIEIIFCHPFSRPTYDRGPMLRQLEQAVDWLRAQGKTRIVICGDLNTPTGSVHFDAIRRNFSQAHEQAGGPFRPTWPSPLPVLTLDQVWYSKGFEIAGDGCQHPWTLASDHKPVVVDLAVSIDADLE